MLQTDLPPYLTTLVLELGQRKLLLPNTAVAEISLLRSLQAAEHAPDWLLGNVEWRGIELPVISFSRLAGEEQQLDEQTRMVVINAVSAPDKLRFFAISINAVPRSLRVDPGLAAQPEQQLGPYEDAAVMLNGQLYYIPRLAAIEKLLLSGMA